MDQNKRSVEEKYMKSKRRRKRWNRLLLCMIIMTLLCTFYILALPAITLEGDTHTSETEELLLEVQEIVENETNPVTESETSSAESEISTEEIIDVEEQMIMETEEETTEAGEDASESESEEESEQESDIELQAAVSITYYVYVNGDRYELLTQNNDMEKDGNRYYVTPETLESVYQKFGFKADTYNGERVFPHTDNYGPNIIWADAAPYQKDGQWRIPLAMREQIYVYYLPANVQGASGYFDTSVGVDDAAMIAANTFYSASVHGLNGEPVHHYVRGGQDLNLTLEQYTDFEWIFSNVNDDMVLTPEMTEQADGTIQYTIRNVQYPIQVDLQVKDTVQEGTFTIVYKADTLEEQRVTLGWIAAESQTVLKEGSINGVASVSEKVTLTKEESHSLKIPDQQVLQVRDGYGRKFTYLFAGWRDKNTGTILGYEDPVSFRKLYRLAKNGEVELEAVWSALDGDRNVRSLNFYVNLACEIMDFGNNGYNDHPTSDFTQSLFSTYVNSTGKNAQFLSDYQLIAPPTSAETAYSVDSTLRKMTEESVQSFSLADFPSDEEIFATMRAQNAKITLDGQVVPLRNLNTDYFQIRWYVMKYSVTDGWHIDGVLVAKSARLNVTKKFLGDAEAVAEIKSRTGDEEYLIQVQDNRDRDNIFYLTLNSWEDEKDRNAKNYYGYHNYDPETDTYTWNLEGHLDGSYTVTEKNYLSEKVAAAAFYRVDEGANAQDWQSYSGEGVTVQMKVYPDDEPVHNYQTVAFRNYYVQSGILRLHKQDSFTHDSMKDVTFKIQSANDRLDLQLKRRPGTSMYSMLNTEGSVYTEAVTESVIVTDGQGDLYLELIAGTYILTETFPDGYSGANEIKFTVDNQGRVIELFEDGSNTTNFVSGLNTNTLNVENVSRLLTTVTIQKDWGDLPEKFREEVEVQLIANGMSLAGESTKYIQTLNEANNWTYTWNDLPLFIDGRVAGYTVRELRIGNVAYDSKADASDGYRDYEVTYDAAKYREGDTGAYSDAATWVDETGTHHYANHVLLTVHNRIAGSKGEILVRKAFQAPDGNTLDKIDGTYSFGLFENEDGSGKPLQIATITYGAGGVIPAEGYAVFEGLTIRKPYYVFELGDDGKAIQENTEGVIGQRSFVVSGGGEKILLTGDKPIGEATITNRMNYEPLPETGGSGTTWYRLVGLLLCMIFGIVSLDKLFALGYHIGRKNISR